MKNPMTPARSPVLLALLPLASPAAAQIAQILDASGGGTGQVLDAPAGLVVDTAGIVYVGGAASDNVFRITPEGGVTLVMDSSGDGLGNPLEDARGVALDASGNLYVAGSTSHNVFRVTDPGLPAQTVTEIIDFTGDGSGNMLLGPHNLVVDGAGNLYVAGSSSDNVFRITPAGAITRIADGTGDGLGNPLDAPEDLALDGAGNLYVSGAISDNAFRITNPAGAAVVSEIIDFTGDGAGKSLNSARGIAADGPGNVFVAGTVSSNVFWITPGGAITEIMNVSGDGVGNPLSLPRDLVLDGSGNIYVAGNGSSFKITPGSGVTVLIDGTGDGAGNPLDLPLGIATDWAENVYLSGFLSDNVFRVGSLPLESGVAQLSLSAGGVQPLVLDAGASNGGALHLLLGTATGTSPGQPFGPSTLPLNLDPYFLFTLASPGAPPLAGSLGVLDAQGQGTALLTVPPATSPTLAGLLLHHAYVLVGSPFASNPVPCGLIP